MIKFPVGYFFKNKRLEVGIMLFCNDFQIILSELHGFTWYKNINPWEKLQRLVVLSSLQNQINNLSFHHHPPFFFSL